MAQQNFSLSMTQDQRQVMVLAPQLRQSLEMLQVPMLELRALIQKELEQNPTLEEIVPDHESVEVEGANSDMDTQDELDFKEEFEVLAKLDEEWRDYFFQDDYVRSRSAADDEKRQYFLDSLPQLESLQEHLLLQLEVGDFSHTQQEIGELIIGNINDDGYLTVPIDDLASGSGFDLAQMEDMLTVIQEFDPIGVGASDLSECLMLQLRRHGDVDPTLEAIVEEHLDSLAAHRFKDVARALKIQPSEVQSYVELISHLDPKPGRRFSVEVANYIVPEIFVHKGKNGYEIMLNEDDLPQVRISRHYRKLMENDATSKEVRSYIRDRIQSSAFMIKSIHQRQNTIKRIAEEIVSVQEAFLDKGIKHLTPLTMATVAEAVGVHETTVSRAVSGKYMQTPSGVFELRYFFTTGLTASDGSSISNQTIKDAIATLVADEDATSPLSDQEIVALLKEDGVSVARRTVAKYRGLLNIPPSHMRRRYA